MIGSGTIINVLAIIAGGLIGLVGEKLINNRIQETLLKANGLCVIFIGLSGALSKMLSIKNDGSIEIQGTIILIVSFMLGSIIGEWINLEQATENFGVWLRNKSGNDEDASFLNAFLTSSFTVCIGAMAIVGSIQDGMLGDNSTLVTKAILDFLIIMLMTASMGKGCIFSAIPVLILQGTVTLLARAIAPLMTEGALNNISMTGSILIFCVGVNLIKEKTFKVANMLPVLVIAAIAGIIMK